MAPFRTPVFTVPPRKRSKPVAYLACVAQVGRENKAAWDNWKDNHSVSSFLFDKLFTAVIGSEVGAALTAGGYGTSSNTALIARWALNRSWTFENPMVVQGIKVGMVGTKTLSGWALAGGIATNVAVGVAVSLSFAGGQTAASYFDAARSCAR